MRDESRIPIILERLRAIWEANPDLRLGQLVVIGTRPTQPCPEIFNVEDAQLLHGLLAYQAKAVAAEQEAELVLGAETDDLLFSKVRKAVASAGGTISESSWGVGGSQEVVTYKIQLPSGCMTLVSETYVGLLLRGPGSLVTELSRAVQSA